MRTASLFSILILYAWVAAAPAVELTFTLDPAASEVAVNGYIIPVEAETMPQGAGSDVTRFNGTILVDVDDPSAPTSIEFVGGAVAAQTSGSWLPEVGGGTPGGILGGDADPGEPMPANYGLEAQAPLVGRLWVAFRDLVLSPASAPLSIEDGSFAADQMLSIEAGSADYTVASFIFSDMNEHVDLVGKVAENLAASPGSYRVENGMATLQLPVELFVEVQDEGTGFSLFELTFTGSVTATALLDMPSDLTGDYNGNGRVEQADLDLVLLNWGQSTADPGSLGWTNDLPDGAIDQAELDKVLLNWGNTPMAGGAASVPEPATWALALSTALLGLVSRRSQVLAAKSLLTNAGYQSSFPSSSSSQSWMS
jgi:hypothetical protein